MSDQHASLTVERWSQFTLDQRILMIGNEMNRASKVMGDADGEAVRRCYERVLRLADLTVEAGLGRGRLREMLRWREMAASQFVATAADPVLHRALFVALLRMTPIAAAQIQELPQLRRRADPPAGVC